MNCFINRIVDINECTSNPSICGNGTCINEIGSYTCNCTRGYRFNNETCIGSYHLCFLNNETICHHSRLLHIDIDECIEPNIDGTFPQRCNISETCSNTNGSYTCTCNPVFNISGTCVCMYTRNYLT